MVYLLLALLFLLPNNPPENMDFRFDFDFIEPDDDVLGCDGDGSPRDVTGGGGPAEGGGGGAFLRCFVVVDSSPPFLLPTAIDATATGEVAAYVVVSQSRASDTIFSPRRPSDFPNSARRDPCSIELVL